MKFTGIVRATGSSLVITLPKKQIENIIAGDQVLITVQKLKESGNDESS